MNEEQFEELVTTLADKLRTVGVYAETSNLLVPQDESVAINPHLQMIATIGDVAFSSRVQNPAQAEIDDQLDDIATNESKLSEDDLVERLKRLSSNDESKESD